MGDNEIKITSRFKDYFNVGPFGFVIIIGLIASSLATVDSTYDAVSQINAKAQACMQTPDYASALNIKFIVTMVLSCVALVLGIIVGIVFRKNPKAILTFGLSGAGLVGILYSLSIKLPTFPGVMKLGISWGSLILFIVLGIIFELKDNGKELVVDDFTLSSKTD